MSTTPTEKKHVCAWTNCRMPAGRSGYCPRHAAQGTPTDAPVDATTPRAATDQWPSVEAAIAELRGEGLAYVQISGRLGISVAEVKRAVRIAKRPDHGVTERWYLGCRCEACSEAIMSDPVVVKAGQLRKQGLTHKQIADQLGVSVPQAERAGRASGVIKGAAAHGAPARWHAGCRCDICLEAMRKDPLITAVAELRNARVTYKEIAASLDVPLVKVQQAGREANACLTQHHVQRTPSEYALGRSRRPARVKAPSPCSWTECHTPALDSGYCTFHDTWSKAGFPLARSGRIQDLTAEQKSEIIVTAVELRLTGMPYAKVGKRLGVSGRLVAKLCRQAGFSPPPTATASPGTTKRSSADAGFTPNGLARAPRRHGIPPRWHAGCRCSTCLAAMCKDPLITAAAELRRADVSYKDIAANLGVSYAQALQAGKEAEACGILVPVHGIPSRWHAGCRCDTCLEAMLKDPLIIAVAELRNERVMYKDIAAQLAVPIWTVHRAGKEATDCGLVDSPTNARTPVDDLTSYWAVPMDAYVKRAPREGVAADAFTPEEWAELASTVGALLDEGRKYAEIAKALGISTSVARQAVKDEGSIGGSDDPDDGIPPQCAWPECGATVRDSAKYCTFHGNLVREGLDPDAPVLALRTPEEWKALVHSVGELRQAGLSINKIALRLGIDPATASDACKESSFDGNPARPAHGSKERWRTGCSCTLCTEAIDADPLITAVRQLRGERKSYPQIARMLGISAARAWQAGKDAGFTGWPERPADEPSPREKAVAQRAEDRARAGAHFRAWTEADEQTVMGSDLSPRELAAMLGRTPSSIHNKRRDLASNAGRPRTKKRPWGPQDDETVMREDLTLQEKADKLGRSYSSVHARRRLLRAAGAAKPPAAAADKASERRLRP